MAAAIVPKIYPLVLVFIFVFSNFACKYRCCFDFYYRKFDSTARIGRYVAVQPCLSQGKCRDSLKIRFTFHRGIRLLTTVKNFWIIVADFIFLQIVNIIG